MKKIFVLYTLVLVTYSAEAMAPLIRPFATPGNAKIVSLLPRALLSVPLHEQIERQEAVVQRITANASAHKDKIRDAAIDVAVPLPTTLIGLGLCEAGIQLWFSGGHGAFVDFASHSLGGGFMGGGIYLAGSGACHIAERIYKTTHCIKQWRKSRNELDDAIIHLKILRLIRLKE